MEKMKNALKEKWTNKQPTINGWCSIGSSFSAEIMAAQGYDSVTVDVQHGALDYTMALPMLQAMRASGVVPMARVPWREPGIIMKMLDAGAMGIICPMVNSGAEAAEFVSFLRYPPLGQRSFGPTRVSFATPEYGIAANDAVLAFAMVETSDGVENLEEIATTPGLDGIYVGPADLTLGVSNGSLPPGFDRQEKEMVKVIQKIAATCREHGIYSALHCGTPEYAAKAISWGFNMTTVSGDSRLLAAATSESVGRFRELTSGKKSPAKDGSY